MASVRLRTANILLIGIKALGNEIAKNLVLAGIGSLTVVDDQVVTEDDLGAQFFITEQHIGMNVCTHITLYAVTKKNIAGRSSFTANPEAQPASSPYFTHYSHSSPASRVLHPFHGCHRHQYTASQPLHYQRVLPSVSAAVLCR